MPRLLLLDNYDSFTWNLAHGLQELGASVEVVLNDEASVGCILEKPLDGLVISPGPGRPEQAGISLELVRAAAGRLPVLGVCLGHQALAQAYGARIVAAPSLMHGKTSLIFHDGRDLFRDLPLPFEATRYHSLAVAPETLPASFEVSARSDDGVIMGLCHRQLALYGVQFHPESCMTPAGQFLLANFLRLVDARGRATAQPAGCPAPGMVLRTHGKRRARHAASGSV